MGRPQNSLVALVDCNNFYVSCERVFQPKLEGQPVIILSNNDGCAVARSNEAKALGIKMGDPLFKIQSIVNRHQVKVFSSNYALYGDMSQRVMAILRSFAENIEIYSIDECFLDLSDLPSTEIRSFAQSIRTTVLQYTGIPVSIGMAPTKTLAKVANYYAKRQPNLEGVCDLSLPTLRQIALTKLPVGEIWGIGPRWAEKLCRLGLRTALQLQQADSHWLRQQFNIMVMRTALELSGVSCIALEQEAPQRQRIRVSRSFGQKITTYTALQQAVATYAARAAEKLRAQRLLAQNLLTFIHTSPFAENAPLYQNSGVMGLATATDDTRDLLATSLKILHRIYQSGHAYKRAGVILLDLIDNSYQQTDFISTPCAHAKQLMTTVDNINQQYGKDTIYFAAQNAHHRPWQMRRERVSGYSTTDFHCLPIVYAH